MEGEKAAGLEIAAKQRWGGSEVLAHPCTEPWVQAWTKQLSAVLPGTDWQGRAFAITGVKFFQSSFTFTPFYKI